MNHAGFENKLTQKVRWLIQGLIISVALNIGLLATFVSLALREKQTPVARYHAQELSGKLEEKLFTNQTLLQEYANYSFNELVKLLEDTTLVEEGLKKRDLALSCLVSFHYFNLEKALGGPLPIKRGISFFNAKQEATSLWVFPDLGDLQYKAVMQYLQTEKWPLTSEGLYYAIKKQGASVEKELQEAFYLTPEFFSLATVLGRTELALEKEKILQMALEGSWDVLSRQHQRLHNNQEYSLAQRRDMLLDYVKENSRTAAQIFIHNDCEFITKRFDNDSVLSILEIGFERSDLMKNICRELLMSPRSEKVHKRVTEMLYFLNGEPLPSRYVYEEAVAHFSPPKPEVPITLDVVPKALVTSAKSIPSTPKSTQGKQKKTLSYTHVVQEGENLWAIAKKYKVSVDAIMKENQMESEKIRVGRTLKIPSKKS